MKNCIISVFIVLSLLVLAFAGCTANKPDDKDGDSTIPDENGENTEGDRTTPDENGENDETGDNNEIVKVVDNAYGQGSFVLDEEEAEALRSALNSLEWVDTGGVCDCDPNFCICIGEAIYHYHSPYHSSHGSWRQGTKEAQDVDRTVEDIIKKYLPMYWD